MNAWISAKDWLPENEDNVLGTDGLEVFVVWHDDITGWNFDGGGLVLGEIRHWMPLPELPK